MDLNILRIDVDRSGRVINTSNLSLNQCSNNNRIHLYYEGDYDFIEMSFRKPDGWLSDKVTLTFDVDGEGYKYAYYDIDQEFTSFIMGGRNAILSANVYLHYHFNDKAYLGTVSGLRINVNYVDDSIVHTIFSQAYITNLNAQIGALQNDFNKFKTGDILVGKAVNDQYGNPIDVFYETKSDAEIKFKTLDDKKLDRQEVSDQTQKLGLLESNMASANLNLEELNKTSTIHEEIINQNASAIEVIKNTTVLETDFESAIRARENAEVSLQKQIDDLASATNVKELVGTRNELNSLDTSKLEVGDRVQILTDSLYDNLSTIVKWNGTGFDYVGKYSSTSYTRSEIDSQHNDIKAVIPNKLDRTGNRIVLMNGSNILGVSNIELKTINGKSVFGAGDIEFPVDAELNIDSVNPIQNKAVTLSLATKADRTDIEVLSREVNEKAPVSLLAEKQNKLIAGANVTITEEGVISVDAAITFEKVEELPIIGKSNVIYLYKREEGQYEELIWVDGKWEDLGFIDINLGNYYSKTEIQSLLSAKADRTELDPIKADITQNKIDIANRALQSSLDSYITLTQGSIDSLTNAVRDKADKNSLLNLATKDEIPDVSIYQEKLVNQENIKSINGVSLLSEGDLLLADTEIVDLGLYVKKEVFDNTLEAELSKKADREQLFSKSYNDLTDKPDLSTFINNNTLQYAIGEVEKKINLKEDKLESGTTIKTINSESILAEGNIDVVIPSDLDDYATQEWVENKNYLTEHQSLEDYALKTELPDLSPYALSEDIPTIPQNVGEFFNDAGYAVASDVDSKYETKTQSSENLKTAKSYTDTEIADVEKLIAESDATTLAGAKTYTDAEITRVESLIGANESSMVEEAKAYTDQTITALIGGAPETLNTLKEISDYIDSDKSAATAMNAKIKANEDAISGINTIITTLSTKTETAKVASDLASHITDANSKFTTVNANITKAQTQADINKTAIADLDKDLKDHESEFTSYKSTNDTKVSGNTAKINTLKQTVTTNNNNFNTYKTNNNNRVAAVETTVGTHIETLSKYGARITTVEGYNTQIQTNKTNIASNLEKIEKNAEDISKINGDIETINGTFDNYYTKTEADAEFLTETGTIAKAQGIVDYNNPTKEIKFTTKETDTEFEISTVDANQILTLLSVMVPNEY